MTQIKTITVQALNQAIHQTPDLLLIDVRETDEWHALHIPHAVLIPKNELPHKIQALAPNPATPIYLHCKSGMRSMMAAEALIEAGYTNVYSVDGGILAWENHGFLVEKA